MQCFTRHHKSMQSSTSDFQRQILVDIIQNQNNVHITGISGLLLFLTIWPAFENSAYDRVDIAEIHGIIHVRASLPTFISYMNSSSTWQAVWLFPWLASPWSSSEGPYTSSHWVCFVPNSTSREVFLGHWSSTVTLLFCPVQTLVTSQPNLSVSWILSHDQVDTWELWSGGKVKKDLLVN